MTLSFESSARVLLVDDDLGVREVTALALKASGYSVVEACSAEEARAILEFDSTPFQALLTDFRMPGTMGTSLIRFVCKKEHNLKTIILMSGDGEQEPQIANLIEEMKGAEVPFYFFRKPFIYEELEQTLNRYLREGRA